MSLKRYPFAPDVGDQSPWGTIQHSQTLGPYCVSVSTAGHGGFWVASAELGRIPMTFRKMNNWFEEDCDWAIPYILCDLAQYDDRDRTAYALQSLERWNPKVLVHHQQMKAEATR